MAYVGRFAPSPTGPLHYGSLVAALASFLDARHSNGQWLLRIEDLDPLRESPTAPAEIMQQLHAFGLHWDGEVLYQSGRLDAYEVALAEIETATYPCTCARKLLPDVYPGTCRSRHTIPSDPYAVRLRVPPKKVSIADVVAGPRYWNLETEIGDFIVKRKDGLHAYQLAVVVDDIFQGVTRIVRGADLLDSTPRQLAVYDQLGTPPPEYLHVPIVVDGSGSKLSKQAHAKPVTTDSPEVVIRHALADLRQETHTACRTINELLAQAARTWDPSRLKSLHDIRARIEYL